MFDHAFDCTEEPTLPATSPHFLEYNESGSSLTSTLAFLHSHNRPPILPSHHRPDPLIPLLSGFCALLGCLQELETDSDQGSSTFPACSIVEQCVEEGPILVRSRSLDWPGSVRLISTHSENMQAFHDVYRWTRTVDILSTPHRRSEVAHSPSPWQKTSQCLLDCRPSDALEHATFFSSDVLMWEGTVYFIDFVEDRFILDCGTNGEPHMVTVNVDCYADPTVSRPSMTSALRPGSDHGLSYDIQQADQVIIILNNHVGEATSALRYNIPRLGTPSPTEWNIQGNSRGLGALGELLLETVSGDWIEAVEVLGHDEIVSDSRLMGYMRRLCNVVLNARPDWPQPSLYKSRPALGCSFRFSTHQEYLEEGGEERCRMLTVQ